ncbi:hypothetical protein, partial [Dysosmobacter welbionis]|uniref:hypothetical protein n=1 Tax=Dysosmobacter welbionis TaxID=2093857 RepID=UPI003079E50D
WNILQKNIRVWAIFDPRRTAACGIRGGQTAKNGREESPAVCILEQCTIFCAALQDFPQLSRKKSDDSVPQGKPAGTG